MKKSKVALVLSGLFCFLFLLYLKNLDYEMANLDSSMLASPNIKDVTNDIQTRFMISPKELGDETGWKNNSFDDENWKKIKIPSYSVTTESDFQDGNFAYYRIHVPKSLMKQFSYLKNELSLGVYILLYSRADIYVNGKLYLSNSPRNVNESVVVVPLEDGVDNLVAIQGTIKTGDAGINHRTQIMLGRGAELNQLYSKVYKAQTVFTLIYILCKGSILFIFALIFFVVGVDKFFEKFLMFGIFVVSEDVLRGDYLNAYLNLPTRVSLYNMVNIGISLYLFLFLADVVNKKIKKNHIIIATMILTAFSFFMVYDILNSSSFFHFDQYLKFWNIILIAILIGFIPKMMKVDPIPAGIMIFAAGLTGWSAFFSENVGHNLKAVGNLLLFFMAAYQTFILFKREQDLLKVKQYELLEQEKDVAIGRTAALLAHDVRRPLEQMNLILNRISSGSVTDEFLKAAKKDVDFSLTSVNNQINDIMNFSRTKEISLDSINFYKVLSGSLKQVLTISKNVSIDLKYDFQAPYSMMGDESRLSSLLTNLISNAVEAIRDIGKKSHGNIVFSTSVIQNDFIFKIKNDGPQIPEDVITEIFKPLFTHGKSKGTGLGLASVAKAMADHKGSIEVSNTPQGVEFKLTFKVYTALNDMNLEEFKSSSTAYSYETTSTLATTHLRPLRLFVLDDDAQVYEYFSFLVDQLNFDVELTFFQSIEESRKAVREKRFDLYILDYDLGHSETGFDFYKQELSYLSSEVVIHTNRDMSVLNSAQCGYQQKPMPIDHLISIVEDVYSKRLITMLVDDSELSVMAWELFNGKHNVTSYSSPEAALKYAKDTKFDVCVLDYYFDNSQMNGESLGVDIHKLYPEMKVFISSNSDDLNTQFPILAKNFFDIRSKLN
jgi:signal transduction histidine kinase/DNA-binding response OmpR family regulator